MTTITLSNGEKISKNEDIASLIVAFEECLGETLAQHAAETAGYGDSWAGSSDQIASMRKDIASLYKLLDGERNTVEIREDTTGMTIEEMIEADCLPF